MDDRKCCACNFGYNHLICTICRHMYSDMCIGLNHLGSVIEHYMNTIDTVKPSNVDICCSVSHAVFEKEVPFSRPS